LKERKGFDFVMIVIKSYFDTLTKEEKKALIEGLLEENKEDKENS